MKRCAFASTSAVIGRSNHFIHTTNSWSSSYSSFVSTRRFYSTTHLTNRPKRLRRPGSGAIVSAAAVDLKYVKDNLNSVRQNAIDRAVSADVELVVQLYNDYLDLNKQVDDLRRRRNENASLMKKASKMQPDQRQQCIEEGKQLKSSLAQLEVSLSDLEIRLEAEASKIPNMTHPNVPKGSEENAATLALSGNKRDFQSEGFSPKSHLDLATSLDLVDFENAARVSGNKFYYLRNQGALLELALINWAMTIAASKGFTVMTTPDVAREDVVSGCGFQPRGEASQVYRVEDTDLCLVGTAEIPLGGFYSGQIVESEKLPIKMAAFSHCFRKEVGAAGSTTRGLYRVHQFSKVELFVICHPDDSNKYHEELKQMEEEMYKSLGLHFRVLDMPTEDLGNPAYRKYDIEAWMPGRDGYGEISSASNCTDYQARRLNIRYRESQGDNRFVHTLNATACAVPRMIVAILETYQQADGSIRIPQVLIPFMGGMKEIKAPVWHQDASNKEAVGAR